MIQNPVLIIGCSRSGTSLLYNMLAEVPYLWSIGYESKAIIEKYHHPSVLNWTSGALSASDLTEISKNYIISEFKNQAASGVFWGHVNQIRNLLRRTQISPYLKKIGKPESSNTEFSNMFPQRMLDLLRSYIKLRNKLLPSLIPPKIQLLEKTPENCLRLPFLLEIFPDARIIYLVRDGRANIYSLMEGWRQSHLFPGYRIPETIKIPGDTRGRWAFTLIPGWRNLLDRPLEEVCAWQWVQCNQAVMDYFETEGAEVPYIKVNFEQMINNPILIMENIYQFIGIPKRYSSRTIELPKINVVSKPFTNKWQNKKEVIERVYPIIKPIMEKLDYM